MSRPYRGLTIVELRSLFDKSNSIKDQLISIHNELTHRKSKKAVQLREEIEQIINAKFTDTSDTTKQKSNIKVSKSISQPTPNSDSNTRTKMQSQSTRASTKSIKKYPVLVESTSEASGHPSKWTPPLAKSLELDIPEDSSRAETFAIAVRGLITDIKKKGDGYRYISLKDGVLSNTENGKYTYGFRFNANDLIEKAIIQLKIDNDKFDGKIEFATSNSLEISIEEDLGELLASCTLIIDKTELLAKLAGTLENIETIFPWFNEELAEATLTNEFDNDDIEEYRPIDSFSNLNDCQKEAVEIGLASRVSYIWGPPGTGKTFTLATLINSLLNQDKRILVCSNTNMAVDQVLLKLCTDESKKYFDLEEGEMLRLGRIAHDEFQKDWSKFVSIQVIIDRLSEDLLKEKEVLHTELALNTMKSDYNQSLINMNNQLDDNIERQKEYANRLKVINLDITKYENEIAKLEECIELLDVEKEEYNRSNAFKKLLRRSVPTIEAEMASVRAKLSDVNSSLADYIYSRDEVETNLDSINVSISALNNQLGDNRKPIDAYLTKISEIQEHIKQINVKIEEITIALKQIEKKAVANAKIVGATVAKTYVTPQLFDNFDVVIIDEASMTMLPVLYVTSGIAQERVIISGDFRQLSPIIETNQESVLDIIGEDVFSVAGITERVNAGIDAEHLVMLDTQFRMEEGICNLISKTIYNGKLKTNMTYRDKSPKLPSPIDKELMIVDTSRINPNACKHYSSKTSKYNLIHAFIIHTLYQYKSDLHGDNDLSIGVITPYSLQAKLHSKISEASNMGDVVGAGTVHCFQGDERGTIIFDVPDSTSQGHVGIFFQADSPDENGASLLNVAISRAKYQLIMFANLEYLQYKLPDQAIFRDMLHNMQSNGQIIDALDVLKLNPIHMLLLKYYPENIIPEISHDSGTLSGKDFIDTILIEIINAKKSILIYSDVITNKGINLFKKAIVSKINSGVIVKCVVSAPAEPGVINDEDSNAAVDELQKIGCIIDTWKKVRDKVVIIDEKIVWCGTTDLFNEIPYGKNIMARTDSTGLAKEFITFLSLNTSKISDIDGDNLIKKDSAICPDCNSRVAYSHSKYGAYWYCEGCKWRQSFDKKPAKQKPITDTTGNQSDIDEKCPECDSGLRKRNGRFGDFIGCTGYPNCRYIKNP